jgi:hypothetical protein
MAFPNRLKGSACDSCGLVLSRDYRKPPVCGQCLAPTRTRKQCLYLGEPTGETVILPCTTCRGNVRIKYQVSACAVHQLCLPTYTGKNTNTMTCNECRAKSFGFEAKEAP